MRFSEILVGDGRIVSVLLTRDHAQIMFVDAHGRMLRIDIADFDSFFAEGEVIGYDLNHGLEEGDAGNRILQFVDADNQRVVVKLTEKSAISVVQVEA